MLAVSLVELALKVAALCVVGRTDAVSAPTEALLLERFAR